MAASFCHVGAEQQIREAPERCKCLVSFPLSQHLDWHTLWVSIRNTAWRRAAGGVSCLTCLLPCSGEPVPEAEGALLPAAQPSPQHSTAAGRRGQAGAQRGTHNAPACRSFPDVRALTGSRALIAISYWCTQTPRRCWALYCGLHCLPTLPGTKHPADRGAAQRAHIRRRLLLPGVPLCSSGLLCGQVHAGEVLQRGAAGTVTGGAGD